jgi:predicted restriction endonuclease
MSDVFSLQLEQLRSLRPDRSSGHSKPHKVCMMLAVMDLIQRGIITENKIYFNDDLKQQFTKWFERFQHGNDKNEPSQPFFYLESSPLWFHKPNDDALTEYRQRIADRKHGGSGVIARIIEYAYLDETLYQNIKSKIVQPELQAALLENIEDLSQRFSRWAISIGRSEKTVKNYLGAINGSISNWLQNAGLSDNRITEYNNPNDFYKMAEKAKRLAIFQERNEKGKGMYNAALKLYGDFLADTASNALSEDINQIEQDQTLTITEKAILVNTRVGQGQYRKSLIDYWGGCTVTGYKNPRFLVASHIKPWRVSNNQERIDPHNGLLLLPNLDKAFDQGYISFNHKGRIQLSEQLETPQTLGVDQDMRITLETHHQGYLAYHRECIYRN